MSSASEIRREKERREVEKSIAFCERVTGRPFTHDLPGTIINDRMHYVISTMPCHEHDFINEHVYVKMQGADRLDAYHNMSRETAIMMRVGIALFVLTLNKHVSFGDRANLAHIIAQFREICDSENIYAQFATAIITHKSVSISLNIDTAAQTETLVVINHFYEK